MTRRKRLNSVIYNLQTRGQNLFVVNCSWLRAYSAPQAVQLILRCLVVLVINGSLSQATTAEDIRWLEKELSIEVKTSSYGKIQNKVTIKWCEMRLEQKEEKSKHPTMVVVDLRSLDPKKITFEDWYIDKKYSEISLGVEGGKEKVRTFYLMRSGKNTSKVTLEASA